MKTRNDCPVCKSNKIEFTFQAHDYLYEVTKDTFEIYHCDSCEAFFLNPYPSAEETAAFYPQNYYSYEATDQKGFFATIKDNILRRHLDPHTKFSLLEELLIFIFKSKYSGLPLYKKKNGKFLDIGCGTGENLKALNKYGWDSYGIEIDKKAVEFAQKQGLQVTHDTLESADFGNKKFDCIRIWHVFEHLTDPHTALKKMSEHLVPGGEILMALPNTDSWPRKLFGTYWYGLDAPRHIINYSPTTLRELVPQYNLRIEKITYASCGPYVGSLSHLLKAKFKFKTNLINNLFLIALTSPLDFITDLFKQGDTIFLTIKKSNIIA